MPGGYQRVILSDNFNIQEGVFFGTNLIDSLLGNDGSLDLLMQIPVGVVLHINGRMGFGALAQVQLFENTTFSDAGTPLVAHNRNRISSRVSEAILTSGPTITGTGTLLHEELIGMGNSEGGTQELDEWIMDDGTNCLLRLFNRASDSQGKPMSLQLLWYEPTATAP